MLSFIVRELLRSNDRFNFDMCALVISRRMAIQFCMSHKNLQRNRHLIHFEKTAEIQTADI